MQHTHTLTEAAADMSVKDLGWVRRRGFSSCFLSGCRRKQRKEAKTASLSRCDTRKVNSESFLL